jgi:hypothetical protein
VISSGEGNEREENRGHPRQDSIRGREEKPRSLSRAAFSGMNTAVDSEVLEGNKNAPQNQRLGSSCKRDRVEVAAVVDESNRVIVREVLF